ncbi:hypothetical protein CEE44_02790 [Candidatus Woesearchaeota archaeon B3_Woes]|nr:MAG: hypothetical protein CEE44_02790 [Candidatus Woesearchaeota archaeon B3_Woes]
MVELIKRNHRVPYKHHPIHPPYYRPENKRESERLINQGLEKTLQDQQRRATNNDALIDEHLRRLLGRPDLKLNSDYAAVSGSD